MSLIVPRQGHGALDHVAQLADVARPGVGQQLLGDAGSESPGTCFFAPVGEVLDEVLRQEQDVGPARAERRQVDLDDVDAEVEILAEAPFLDGRLQVAVRGGKSRTSKATSCSPPTGRTLLSSSARSSFGCMASGMSPISSSSSVPPSACTKRPCAVVAGVGESALDMPEQLAFQERIGQRGAVDRHERPLARRLRWCRARATSFLAGAAFARDQHRGVGVGDLRQLVVEPCAWPDFAPSNSSKRAGPRPRLAERADLLLELPPLDAPGGGSPPASSISIGLVTKS